MKRENLNIKTTINFIEVNGFGTVRLDNGSLCDIFVYGYFKMFHWTFIVNQDLYNKDCVVVSESSTGQRLSDYCYDDVESAIGGVLPYIREKRYYFFTKIGDQLTKYRCDLTRRNSTNLQTLAIDSMLW